MNGPLSDLRRSFEQKISLTVPTSGTKCIYLWKRIDHEFKADDPLCRGLHSDTLHFEKFCKFYEGKYKCIVTDANNDQHSETLSATLTYDGQ